MASAWIEHVKKFYAAKKKKDSSYKYSSALKDASKTYKKGKVAVEAVKKTKRKRKKKREIFV